MSTHPLGVPNLSLRQLKAAMFVARHSNLTKAAKKLNRSQTAVTKAITNLEDSLGVSLFNRSRTGMIPTAHGEILVRRVERAEREFQRAGEAYLKYKPDVLRYQCISLFSMDISYKRLASFIALYDTRGIVPAAKSLGITRAAIYNSIRQLEDLLDLVLFERNPNGLSPTSFCKTLSQQIKLVFSEVRHALEEMNSLSGVASGNVVIGTLPYTRTTITPRAINKLHCDNPQIEVSTYDSPYSILEALLRRGDIDLIVGAIRDNDSSNGLKTEELFEDSLSLIVKKDHPLLDPTRNGKPISHTELVEFGWVLSARNTPSREIFDNIFNLNNRPMPGHTIFTSSLSTARGLLMESERIALLSTHQVYYELKYGMLEALPIKLENSTRAIGFTIRANSVPSPATSLFIDCLRDVASQIHPES